MAGLFILWTLDVPEIPKVKNKDSRDSRGIALKRFETFQKILTN